MPFLRSFPTTFSAALSLVVLGPRVSERKKAMMMLGTLAEGACAVCRDCKESFGIDLFRTT
jgi:hypothetical protein